MHRSMKTRLKHKTGFTLVETLVAISILILVIIGPMTTAQRGIQTARYANEQMTAVFLAQEAIEAVRELRDKEALRAYVGGATVDTSMWSSNVVSDCDSGCAYVRGMSNPFRPCGSTNNNCRLLVDENHTYTHEYSSVNRDSPFTRTVTVGTPVSGGVPVTVDVEWQSTAFNATPKHVILQTWIYDHYQRYENN